MPAKNYSHMMMEDEHLVGDGVGDDGGEEALKILLSRVENGINQSSKTKIMVVAVLWFAKSSLLLAAWVFRVYNDVHQRGAAELTTEAQTEPGSAAWLADRATWSRLHPVDLMMANFSSFCSF
jgi:hypothetical protein